MKRRQWGVAIVCLLIGAGTVAVVRGQPDDEFLASARETDLVRLLDDLQARQTRLDGETLRLQTAEERLKSGTSAEALAQTQKRADQLRVLAGTTAVRGPGITMRIEARGGFFASDLLNAVQELRDAGAEAIAINGQRVVVNTWFADEQQDISMSGTRISQPYVVEAIGGPETMATAMRIPGGVVDTVSAQDGTVTITQSDRLTISATVDLPEPDPNIAVTD